MGSTEVLVRVPTGGKRQAVLEARRWPDLGICSFIAAGLQPQPPPAAHRKMLPGMKVENADGRAIVWATGGLLMRRLRRSKAQG